MRRSSRLLPLFLCLLPLTGGARLAADEAVQARQSDAPLALLVTGRGTEIWQRDGSQRLELPPGAALDAIEALDDGWVAAGTRRIEDETELYLLRSDGDTVSSMPAPPGRFARRGGPALIVAQGALAGIAWLEGDRQETLTVRAAAWTGSSWGAPELVSPAGPGAQLAASGAALADGSWLLAWAAVDGHDDEILWSVRRDSAWSAPRRVHEPNAVPDITPSVVALGDGALVAWAALDRNHYRLRFATFDGEGWTPGAPFGADGSTRPSFVRHGLERYLLYKSVAPEIWSLLELDSDGVARRRAELATKVRSRPILDLRNPDAVFLLWPALDAGSRAPETAIPWQEIE